MKSDIEIKDAIYDLIKNSALEQEVTGTLSKRGRPFGSTKEDIVISVLSNDGCGQKQEVFVNVNIYVSEIKNTQTLGWEIDDIRCRELCDLSKFLFSAHGPWFRIDNIGSKQKVHAASALYQDGHSEWIINNKLLIEISNEV